MLKKILLDNNVNSSIRLSVAFNILLISIMFASVVTPLLSNTISTTSLMCIYIIWFLFSFSKCEKIFKSKVFIIWMLLLMLQLVYGLVGISKIPMNNFLSRFDTYGIPIIGIFVLSVYNKKEKYLLAILLVLILSFNIINNVLLGKEAIEVFGNLSQKEAKETVNIGGTVFVAVCLFAVGVFLIIVKYAKKNLLKYASIVMILFASYFALYINARGIASSLIAVLLVASVFLKYFDSRRSLKSVFIIGVLIILVIYIMQFVLPFFAETLGSERLMNRFDEMTLVLSGIEAEGSFSSRLFLTGMSLTTFFSSTFSFLFGVGENLNHADSISEIIRYGVGMHSEFIDVLARYGIIGGLLMYYAVWLTYITIKKYLRGDAIAEWNVLMLVFVLYSILNNSLERSILYVVFVLFPLVLFLITDKKVKYE